MSRKRRRYMRLSTFFRWILPGLLSLLCSLKRYLICRDWCWCWYWYWEFVFCLALHWVPSLSIFPPCRLRRLFLLSGILVAWIGQLHLSNKGRELENWICLIGLEPCLGFRHVFYSQIERDRRRIVINFFIFCIAPPQIVNLFGLFWLRGTTSGTRESIWFCFLLTLT